MMPLRLACFHYFAIFIDDDFRHTTPLPLPLPIIDIIAAIIAMIRQQSCHYFDASARYFAAFFAFAAAISLFHSAPLMISSPFDDI